MFFIIISKVLPGTCHHVAEDLYKRRVKFKVKL